MMLLCIHSLVIALLAGSAVSQEFGWQPGQINATMCLWDNPRAAVVRDAFYIDGGYLWWKPGLSDGTYGSITNDENPLGIVYSLNFSDPFTVSSNFSQIFSRQYKGPNDQQAETFAPQYFDGYMFSNDNDWLGYGGLLTITDSNSDPPNNSTIEGYEAYTDVDVKRVQPGFYQEILPAGLTRYLAYGGGVSIPVQNQGFYFGGLRAADFGEIYFPTGSDNNPTSANVLSNTLISVDLTNQGAEKWTNTTIPSNIPGRASPELVWIPVANMGALIAIGGVVLPEYDNVEMADNTTQAATSNITSPKFMETVAVYNIENSTWFQQDTTGSTPPATAEGCTVVASADDGSSHNVYWYGGFNGIDATSEFYDDVYVLSVPSFTWTKLYSGNSTHGRASHRCAKPYPDQMFVLGGYPSQAAASQCLEGGIVQVFNLSSGEWLESYNPANWSDYSVPSSVTAVIGGSEKGGATLTSPPTWADESLSVLFGTAYTQTSKIVNYFPYNLAPTPQPNSTTPSGPITITHTGGGLPSWVAPVLGVVLGLMALTAIIVILLLWRRRRYLRSHASEIGASDLNRYRIMSWVRGMPTETGTKAGTVTTDETPRGPMSEVDPRESNVVIAHEAAEGQVHEMMDTSRPQELHDTGLTYTDISASPSFASRVSRMTTHASRRFPTSPGTPRPESPSLGTIPGAIPPSRATSGVSSLGSRHRQLSLLGNRHRKQVSEVGSVSSASTAGGLKPLPADLDPSPETSTSAEQTFLSPISPPTPENHAGLPEATDYLTHGGTAETEDNAASSKPLIDKEKENRRSNFEEDLDE